jgi:predicted nucleotidyltransferase
VLVSDLEQSLRDVVSALNRCRASFALVGGLAVAVRAEPRLTRDADLAVAVANDDEAQALVHNLRSDGYEPFAAVEHERVSRLATVRLGRPGSERSVVTDLLFASSGIEREIVASAEPIEVLPGLTLPVAQVGHLIVMKLLARDDRHRPADADDLQGLRAVADEHDWETAYAGARLVIDRGFDRDRDLIAAIEQLKTDAPW